MSKKKQKNNAKSKLTTKQKKWADEYIKTGNATQSAINAGYSEKTAKQIGTENLAKPVLKAYIAKQLEKIESDKIMGAKEALQLLTSIARGEGHTKQLMKYRDQTWFEDVPPSFRDRLDAAKEILKRYPTSELERAQIRQAQAAATESEVKAQLAKQQIKDHQTTDNIVIKALKDMPREEIVRLARELGNRHAKSSD